MQGIHYGRPNNTPDTNEVVGTVISTNQRQTDGVLTSHPTWSTPTPGHEESLSNRHPGEELKESEQFIDIMCDFEGIFWGKPGIRAEFGSDISNYVHKETFEATLRRINESYDIPILRYWSMISLCLLGLGTALTVVLGNVFFVIVSFIIVFILDICFGSLIDKRRTEAFDELNTRFYHGALSCYIGLINYPKQPSTLKEFCQALMTLFNRKLFLRFNLSIMRKETEHPVVVTDMI